MKKIFSGNQTLSTLSFSFYGSLPVFLTSILIYFYSEGEVEKYYLFFGTVLFLFTFLLLVFVLRISSMDVLLFTGVLFLLLYAGIIVFAFVKIQRSYTYLISGLFFTPLLTIGLYLIQKHYPRQAIEQSSLFIDLGLYLSASYFTVIHVFTLYLIFSSIGTFIVIDLLIEFYEILNLIPLFFVIFRLKRDSSTVLEIREKKIFFQGRDLSALFSDLQKNIFLLLISDDSKSRNCRELSQLFPEPCKEEGACKPSICPLYSNIYRQVSDLKKNLSTLQIGSIVTPANKQKIRESGWRIRLYSGVRIKFSAGMSDSSTEEVVSVGSEAENQQSRFSETAVEKHQRVLILVSIFSSLSLSAELMIQKIYGYYGFAISTALFFSLFFLSTVYRKKRYFVTAMIISFILIEIITLYFAGRGDAETALFLTLKNLTLFLVIFLLKYNQCESRGTKVFSRASVFRAIFWILWFYMAALLVFRNYNFPLLINTDRTGVIELVSDGIALFAALISSFWFLRHQNKVLIVKKQTIDFSGKSINDSLSPENLKLFRFFLRMRGGKVTCSNIVSFLYPEESKMCRFECKASRCPAYQRIYKRIREIRKVVEVFEIGTIVSPGKNTDVKNEGWKLMIYADIGVRMQQLSRGNS